MLFHDQIIINYPPITAAFTSLNHEFTVLLSLRIIMLFHNASSLILPAHSLSLKIWVSFAELCSYLLTPLLRLSIADKTSSASLKPNHYFVFPRGHFLLFITELLTQVISSYPFCLRTKPCSRLTFVLSSSHKCDPQQSLLAPIKYFLPN